MKLDSNVISQEVKNDLDEIRRELKKSNPNSSKLFELLAGSKYNRPINPKRCKS